MVSSYVDAQHRNDELRDRLRLWTPKIATLNLDINFLFCYITITIQKQRSIMKKFAIANEHHLHFEKQQFIELEGVIPMDQILQLQLNVNKTMNLSMAEYGQWSAQPLSDELFLEGRDLWRKNDFVKKIVLDKELVGIASELLRQRFVRLGYDQFLLGGSFKSVPENPNDNLLSARTLLTTQQTNLDEISCIRGALCGLIICLRSAKEPLERQPGSLFPVEAGHMTFFTAQANIDFSELSKREGQEFLLIVYAEKTTLYVANEKDPHWHGLKRLGYVFGDRVRDNLHPVLHR